MKYFFTLLLFMSLFANVATASISLGYGACGADSVVIWADEDEKEEGAEGAEGEEEPDCE